jgi:hypothetical protein
VSTSISTDIEVNIRAQEVTTRVGIVEMYKSWYLTYPLSNYAITCSVSSTTPSECFHFVQVGTMTVLTIIYSGVKN